MMKKIILLIFLVFPLNVKALTDKVELYRCIDGDTAKFKINHHIYSTRFLAVDTPEIRKRKNKYQKYGKEASIYTCKMLRKAKEIMIEYDENSDLFDRYHRLLAWIFVDQELLQEKLVEEGFAKVAYLFGNYKYTQKLKKVEEIAKLERKGIWSKK